MIELDIGKGQLNTKAHSSHFLDSFYYYQGLPIRSPLGGEYFTTRNIIHLDNSFAVRMPDRESLINADDAKPVIQATLIKAWKEHLLKLKATEAPEQFIRHYEALRAFGLLGLLNDIDLIPHEIVHSIHAYPTQEPYYDFHSHIEHDLEKEKIKTGQVRLVYNLDTDPDAHDGMSFAVMTMMHQEDWLYLKNPLDPGHWVYQDGMAINMDTAEIAVERTPTHVAYFDGNTASANLELVDSLTIRVNQHATSYSNVNIGLTGMDDSGDSTIIVTNDADSVLHQINSFSEDERFNEDWSDQDHRSLSNLIAVLRGESAEATVVKALNVENITHNDNCVKTSTAVIIGQKYGKVLAYPLQAILADYAKHLGVEHDEACAAAFLAVLQERNQNA